VHNELLIFSNQIIRLKIYKQPASQSIGQAHVSTRSESLSLRLKLDPKRDGDFVPLPAPLLRKYIAYSRTFVFPR